MSTYSVYVIELDDTVCRKTACPSLLSGKPHVYVGETKHTPEERLEVHRAGGFTARPVVTKHGMRLRPRLYKNWRPCKTRTASRAAEARLAKRLRKKGYCVRGGH